MIIKKNHFKPMWFFIENQQWLTLGDRTWLKGDQKETFETQKGDLKKDHIYHSIIT